MCMINPRIFVRLERRVLKRAYHLEPHSRSAQSAFWQLTSGTRKGQRKVSVFFVIPRPKAQCVGINWADTFLQGYKHL